MSEFKWEVNGSFVAFPFWLAFPGLSNKSPKKKKLTNNLLTFGRVIPKGAKPGTNFNKIGNNNLKERIV